MMWVVQHKWRIFEWFAFYCYLRWNTLVIREGDGTGHLLHINEWVTQGDPLAMIKYGLDILPLIWDLWTANP